MTGLTKICFYSFLITITQSDPETNATMTVNHTDYEFYRSNNTAVVSSSDILVQTLSFECSDAMLASLISKSIVLPPYSTNWCSGASAVSADYELDSWHYNGDGHKMEFCLIIPCSIKNATYHCQWFEVTRDSNGNQISSTKQGCSVVGTGDPNHPAVSDIKIVALPAQPGTITEENVTIVTTDPPSSSPPPPPGTGGPGPGIPSAGPWPFQQCNFTQNTTMKKIILILGLVVGTVFHAGAQTCSTCGSLGAANSLGDQTGPSLDISLGSLQYGQPAGNLSFSSCLPDPQLFTPAALQLDAPLRSLIVVVTNSDGGLRQINVPQALRGHSRSAGCQRLYDQLLQFKSNYWFCIWPFSIFRQPLCDLANHQFKPLCFLSTSDFGLFGGHFDEAVDL